MTEHSSVKPVFVVGGLYSLANGVAWIMRDLAAALARIGSPVTVCAADCWGRGAASIGHIFEPPTRWVSSRGLWMGGLSWSPALRRRMTETIDRADVVHAHSLWMLPNSYAAQIAGKQSKPLVFTAHGALEPWALRNSGWKKRVVGRWFQNRDLRQASCIHVNSLSEADGIRRYGLDVPIAVIPNGISPEEFSQLPPSDEFHQRFPETKDKKIVLFMARLHEKKGLGHLLPAWSRLWRNHPDWHLVLAGPDSGYESTARQHVRESGMDSSVTFTGNLQDRQRLAALAVADVFVQPSFSEGFSMSVLEALTCGLPALITPGCNFQEAADAGAAVCVEPTTDETEQGLRQLIDVSADVRERMGRAGRNLIQEGYTWDSVARRTQSLYDWLLNGGQPPSCVLN